MCLIAHREVNGKRGSNIPNDVISYNLRSNPDGFGIAWRDPERGLVWEKFGPSRQDGEDFRNRLKTVDAMRGVEYAAHWRFATHGPKCVEMSHPFPYTDRDGNQVLVFHNGVIDIKTAPSESDTAAYVRGILSKMPPRWWADPGLIDLVEWSIGWSRLLLMTPDETVRINKVDWEQQGGIWYSTGPRGYAPLASIFTDKDDDDKEEDRVLLTSTTTNGAWYDRVIGDDYDFHRVTMIDKRSLDQDDYAEVMCEDCYMTGEVYQIDGTSYVDVKHYVASTVAVPA